MARPPIARDKALRAYLDLLVEGERNATVDAVAARAGISKGGVLYHFPSKDDLADAALARFAEVSAADLESMRNDPEGSTRNFIRTSWQTDDALEPIYRAALRLAQAGHEGAVHALSTLHDGWLELLEAELSDPALARVVMLIGDGLYHHATMPGTWSRETFGDVDSLLAQVERLIGR